MAYSKETIEVVRDWLDADIESAKEDDPDTGIFRNDELVSLLEHIRENFEDWLAQEGTS